MTMLLQRLSDGNGNKQLFAAPSNVNIQAQANFSTATLRNASRTYVVGRLEAVARQEGVVIKHDNDDSGMVIPVVVKLSASAPVGTDLRVLKAACEAVFNEFADHGTVEAPTLTTSVFFPVVNSITV